MSVKVQDANQLHPGDTLFFPNGFELYSLIYNERFKVDSSFPVVVDCVTEDGYVIANNYKVQLHPDDLANTEIVS